MEIQRVRSFKHSIFGDVLHFNYCLFEFRLGFVACTHYCPQCGLFRMGLPNLVLISLRLLLWCSEKLF